MKHQRTLSIYIFSMLASLFCSSVTISGQDNSKDIEEIKKIFFQQEKDWNNGDIDAFMKAYWNSEDMQFGGAGGITKGWQLILPPKFRQQV